ncbi:unnamed protein product [Blumeria hordei]|uniref:Elongator complex protein 2 n=1 Tax=Blumeria hordei TaxID=2867405 RepID=A0A383UQK8_BLUHO|nr:unnamed protein product [Blumeria hordei]
MSCHPPSSPGSTVNVSDRMLQVSADYLSAGANRHSSAADWDASGLLAFGADRNIALWEPLDKESRGISALLTGHTDKVNALKFLPASSSTLLSGSVDQTLKVWKKCEGSDKYKCIHSLSDHTGSIHCLAVSKNGAPIFASGAADSTVRIWSHDEAVETVTLQQTITLQPKLFPLALALTPLIASANSYLLAVAGTRETILLYVRDSKQDSNFQLQVTLSGHEGWIRSLDFIQDSTSQGDILLASASQDKYIRLWRISQGYQAPSLAADSSSSHSSSLLPGKTLANKTQHFQAESLDYSASFEALLFGHEDWIYSCKWKPAGSRLQLLSASADNSLAIWEPDESTGVYTIIARMGEISSEKGSTTATGSTGGFWMGLWAASGNAVVCLGRTGSWKLWTWNVARERWIQGTGVSGHTDAVNSIAWSKGGEYLLSTSADQTTRLHAEWKRDGRKTWHEMARPQIHGYNLSCVDTLGSTQFVSGAEEKLLRVFKIPRTTARLLNELAGTNFADEDDMPIAANMPVLGLSNRTISTVESGENVIGDDDSPQGTKVAPVVEMSKLDINHLPHEDQLSRDTLWPEIEKLYGHGYEISALATSHGGNIVATACKASSIDHAVIRLYETKTWHEIKPPLTAHSLTVTSLCFSPDDKFLLSVGRDRLWSLFQRADANPHQYQLQATDAKSHSRMILDAAWAPGPPHIFATAGRDRQVKLWTCQSSDTVSPVSCAMTIPRAHPITAIQFLDSVTPTGCLRLAIGDELGHLAIFDINISSASTIELSFSLHSPPLNPSGAITQLAWRPTIRSNPKTGVILAVASEDSSVRIYSMD